MIHLDDWLTTPAIPFASKITSETDRILHDHSFFEIFYMLDGSVDHTLNGKTTALFAGDILFLKPEDRHIFLRDANNTCRHRDILLRKSFFRSVCNFISPDLFEDFTSDQLPKKFHLSSARIKQFEETLEKISAVPTTDSAIKMAAIRSFSADILGILVSAQLEQRANYPAWFQELMLRFNDPAMICGGLDMILSDVFYTKEHVCRVFKQTQGMTMTEYLNNRRLELAADRLACSREQVSAISLSLGFSSVSYFNRIFKEKYGYTPVQFRNKTAAQR